MSSSGAVQVKLELGHRALARRKPTPAGFTHDWTVFVRGPEIHRFVDKVVFHLHESFPKPKRVCKDPPYKVDESGYAGFILPIEVYFKNKEEPKKVRFDYDLFLHLEGHPPVNHLRCEKLTFNNPTDDFRRKLLKAGGRRDPHRRSSDDSKVMVLQEGCTPQFGHHLKLTPTFGDPKKIRGVPKGAGAAAFPPKASKSARQPKENQPMSFKEPKEGVNKRPSGDADARHATKKPKLTNRTHPDDSDQSDSEQPSPAGSSSSSGGTHRRQVLGPLQSVLKDARSDDDDDDSPHAHLAHYPRRVSLSDGSESDSNEALLTATANQEALLTATANQEKTYLDELVELHTRLMTLREGHILQQIVNLIEETGHFHITTTTFDFDLCSLDKKTVRKLQSYLETSGRP